MDGDGRNSAETLATETESKTGDISAESTSIEIKMVEDFTQGFLSAFLPEVGNLQERLGELTYVTILYIILLKN